MGLVEWLLRARLPELDDEAIDEVWVLPVFEHPYAEKRGMPSFEHRLRMAELAFRGLERVRVLDVERDVAELRGGPAGTIDTVRFLRSRYPNHRFALVVGQDAYADLRAGRWKDSALLAKEVEVVPVRRPGEPGDSGHLVPWLEELSSTSVRRSEDADWIRSAVPEKVLSYIREHELYGLPED